MHALEVLRTKIKMFVSYLLSRIKTSEDLLKLICMMKSASLTLKEENVKKRLPSWVPRIEKKEKNIRFLLRERMRLLFCLLRVKLKLMSLKRKKIH